MYLPDGISLIRSQNIYNDRFQWNGLAHISDEHADELANVEVETNDVLLNITGDSVARCCLAPATILPARVNQHVAIIRPHPDRLDARYLRYFLVSPGTQQHLLMLASAGATRNALTKEMIEDIIVPAPPLAEQKRIADILGGLDDKIELNRRTNETLEAMARALFKSWFVDFDPVKAKAAGRKPAGMDPATAAIFPAAFQDSPLGLIPKGWQVSQLQDLATKIGSGATPRGGSSAYSQEGVSFIRSQNVYDHEFHWEGLAHLNAKLAADLQAVEVQAEDILFNITGASILRSCVVDPAVLPARVNQHVAIIRARAGMPPRFLHLFLVQPPVRSLLAGLDAGATRQAVTKGQLEAVNVLRPAAAVLDRFNYACTSLFRQIDRGRSESRILAAIRDALLPKLLSGEIRMKAAGRLAAEVG